MEIPKSHKAIIYSNPGTLETRIVDVETPEPQFGEVLIHLTHSGVCHSDYGFIMNHWPTPTPKNQIGGHEGVGKVVKLGPNVSCCKIGDRVGVKWLTSACLICDMCINGYEARCSSKKVSGGGGSPGTFQQYVTSDARYVTPIPEGFDSAAAAPLLCGGLTVYAALLKAELKPGMWVAISGAGGGLGHLAIQYAKTNGNLVLAIDHGSKKEFCLGLGADAFIDFTKFDNEALAADVRRLTGGGAHAVLVINASSHAYNQSLDLLRYGGVLVCVGVPERAPTPISSAIPGRIIGNMVTIKGTAVGSRAESVRCLELAARGSIKTQFRLEPMSKLSQIFSEMTAGTIQGRVVLDLSKIE